MKHSIHFTLYTLMPQTSTHSYTMAEATIEVANLRIGCGWGFSVLLKDTW